MSERRQHTRRRTLLNGRLEVEKLNDWTVDCTVRNVSDAGARLTIPEHVIVPECVSLAISDRPGHPAKLVWYREGHAGFTLIEQRATQALPFDGGAARATGSQNGVTQDRLAARVAAIAARPTSGRFTRP